jgi:uncharacterized delta-60 repeat protein
VRRVNFTRGNDWGAGLAIQADGKIVTDGLANFLVGREGVRVSQDWKFAFARYNTDGSLDPSFGRDGKVMTNLTPGRDWAFEVALQSNGKIVAAGKSSGRFALARYRGS